jgi:hypothetical protein
VRALQLEKQEARELKVAENLREDQHQLKTPSWSEGLAEEEITYKFFSPLIVEHWKKLRRPHEGRLPDVQRYMALDLD